MEGVWRAANNLQHAIFGGGAYEVGRAQGLVPQIRPNPIALDAFGTERLGCSA